MSESGSGSSPDPLIPTLYNLVFLPAAGVLAKLVDEPPAINPLQDLPFVVVPGWER